MASYVVFDAPGDRQAPILVCDSFRWAAFLVPLLWFLWHRLWIEAFAVLALTVAFVALIEAGGPVLVLAGLAFLLMLVLGFEAPALKMTALRRRGWEERSVVDAESREEAEIRYLSGMDEKEARVSVPPAATQSSEARRGAPRPRQPGLGLFDYPGGA